MVVGNIFVLYISVVRAIYRCFLLQFPLRPKQRGEHANRVWRRRCLLCQPHSMVALYFDKCWIELCNFSLLLLLKRREKERREETQRDKALHRKQALGQHIRLEICNKRTRPLPSLYRRQRYRLRYAYFILSFLFSFSPP